MLLQLIAIALGAIGYFTEIQILFWVGGFLSLGMDILAFLRGQLNPLLPIVLYIVGMAYMGSWEGILFGALIGQLVELVFILLALVGVSTYSLFSKAKRASK